MPFLTNEDIEKRKEKGKTLYKLNCGWNLTPEQTTKTITFVNRFKPKTPVEIRNKRILEYAFLHDMNACQIARQNDPLLIGMGNRSRGKPLSATSIWKICVSYFPELKKRKEPTATRKKRNNLYQQRQKGEIKKPQICSCCGSTDNLQLHHIIPIQYGGTNDYFNLIYLCHDCHMKLHYSIYNALNFSSGTKSE